MKYWKVYDTAHSCIPAYRLAYMGLMHEPFITTDEFMKWYCFRCKCYFTLQRDVESLAVALRGSFTKILTVQVNMLMRNSCAISETNWNEAKLEEGQGWRKSPDTELGYRWAALLLKSTHTYPCTHFRINWHKRSLLGLMYQWEVLSSTILPCLLQQFRWKLCLMDGWMDFLVHRHILNKAAQTCAGCLAVCVG